MYSLQNDTFWICVSVIIHKGYSSNICLITYTSSGEEYTKVNTMAKQTKKVSSRNTGMYEKIYIQLLYTNTKSHSIISIIPQVIIKTRKQTNHKANQTPLNERMKINSPPISPLVEGQKQLHLNPLHQQTQPSPHLPLELQHILKQVSRNYKWMIQHRMMIAIVVCASRIYLFLILGS